MQELHREDQLAQAVWQKLSSPEKRGTAGLRVLPGQVRQLSYSPALCICKACMAEQKQFQRSSVIV